MKNRIKELRARYDLTQQDLAKLVGVRRETIVFLEKGRYMPSLRLAHDVATALRTTLDEVFIFASREETQERESVTNSLVNAPDSKASNKVQEETHGPVGDEIHEVTEENRRTLVRNPSSEPSQARNPSGPLS